MRAEVAAEGLENTSPASAPDALLIIALLVLRDRVVWVAVPIATTLRTKTNNFGQR